VTPVGRGDVATERDVDAVVSRIDRLESRMDRSEGRLTYGFDRLHRDLRLQLYRLLGFFATALYTVLAVVA